MLNNGLTLENITYAINRIYANGHNLTIADSVDASNWPYYSLYAGGTADSNAADTQTINVQSGDFIIAASGNGKTTHNANVDVIVGSTADVKLAGAYMGATVTGNVTFTVGNGVQFDEFLGEQNGGKINGDLTLKVIGTPILEGYNPTYKASVNHTDPFGTLDLREASTDFISANKDKFTGFASVLTTN